MNRSLAYLTVEQHKQDKTDSPLRPVWVVAKGWGHGGYEWYVVTDDRALLCAACVKANYRQIVDSTLRKASDGWRVISFTNSGDMDEPDMCAHCGRNLGPETGTFRQLPIGARFRFIQEGAVYLKIREGMYRLASDRNSGAEYEAASTEVYREDETS